MRTYLIETALIDSAAGLCGLSLTENYAVLGSLRRFCDKNLGAVQPVKGMEDIKERAESFRFGARCGKVLAGYLASFSPQQLLAAEARVARLFLAPQLAADLSISTEDKKATLKAVVQAMVKRAQIRTHTAKPGGEDINLWLDRYHEMQENYLHTLDEMIDAILTPDAETEQNGITFINEADEIVRMVLAKEYENTERALTEKPSCIFGKILQEILSQNDFGVNRQ